MISAKRYVNIVVFIAIRRITLKSRVGSENVIWPLFYALAPSLGSWLFAFFLPEIHLSMFGPYASAWAWIFARFFVCPSNYERFIGIAPHPHPLPHLTPLTLPPLVFNPCLSLIITLSLSTKVRLLLHRFDNHGHVSDLIEPSATWRTCYYEENTSMTELGDNEWEDF